MACLSSHGSAEVEKPTLTRCLALLGTKRSTLNPLAKAKLHTRCIPNLASRQTGVWFLARYICSGDSVSKSGIIHDEPKAIAAAMKPPATKTPSASNSSPLLTACGTANSGVKFVDTAKRTNKVGKMKLLSKFVVVMKVYV